MDLFYQIPPKRRELYLKVWGGFMPLHDITACLFYLDAHFPDDKIDRALNILVRNKLTGKSFADYFKFHCQSSMLELHRRLLGYVEGEKKLRAIYAGKDFKI